MSVTFTRTQINHIYPGTSQAWSTKNLTPGSLLVVFASGNATATPTISDGVNTWSSVVGPSIDSTGSATWEWAVTNQDFSVLERRILSSNGY